MCKITNIFFITLLFAALFTQTVQACTPVSCMSNGHNQDTLIIGKILSVTKDSLHIAVIFIFPQNKIKSLKEKDEIIVKYIFTPKIKKKSTPTLIPPNSLSIAKKESSILIKGKKYLLSLNKETKDFSSFYSPAWGMFEVEGNSYLDMQLIKNAGFEHKELQTLINSRGDLTKPSKDEASYLYIIILVITLLLFFVLILFIFRRKIYDSVS